jgi:hypothetical protein
MVSGKSFLAIKKSSAQIICSEDEISLSMQYPYNVSVTIFLIIKTLEAM